jgi:hypothetical protein
MDWPARARNSFGQAPEFARAIRCNAAKIPGRLWPSFLVAGWQVNQFASFGVFFRRFHQFIEFAARLGIALHLPIPIIILERMQQRFQLATLLQRKPLNRTENFSNRAHAGKLSAIGNGVNQANVWKHQNLLRSFFVMVEHGW